MTEIRQGEWHFLCLLEISLHGWVSFDGRILSLNYSFITSCKDGVALVVFRTSRWSVLSSRVEIQLAKSITFR